MVRFARTEGTYLHLARTVVPSLGAIAALMRPRRAGSAEMNSVYRRLRPVTIGLVAGASVVAGMIAVWDRAPRDVMEVTPTWIYLGILALLLCPLVTLAAWAWDKRAARHETAPTTEECLARAERTSGTTERGDSSPVPAKTAVFAAEEPTSPSTSPECSSQEEGPHPAESSRLANPTRRRSVPGNRHRAIRHAAR
jgi:hypothetical protein